jgi:spore germination cell wall hydrolase CwlJ-like protein
MTQMTATEVADNAQLSKNLIRAITATIMVIALSLSFYGLSWMVKDKFNRIEAEPTSNITTKVRERQLSCLARNIYYEAGSEPFEGMVAVAQVTLNRMESGKFPNDVCEVVYQKNGLLCQFSWYCSQAAVLRPIHQETYNESMEVAKKVLLEGFRLPALKEALFFHGDYIDPKWNRTRVAKIGRHIFYK